MLVPDMMKSILTRRCILIAGFLLANDAVGLQLFPFQFPSLTNHQHRHRHRHRHRHQHGHQLPQQQQLEIAKGGPQNQLPLQLLSRSPLFSSKLDDVTTTTATTATTPTASSSDQDHDEMVGAWIPIASVANLKGLGPQRITTMNVDFVVWHTDEEDSKDDKWTVQVDACAHRLAPLSQGRVVAENNCIECPYHGWQYDTEGTVANITQLDKGTDIGSIQKMPRANVQTFPTHAVGGMLFVFLPTSLHGEMFPQSLLPEQYYPFLKEKDSTKPDVNIFVRDLPYSFDFLVENFMDPAHIPFAHHKLQSTRDDGCPIEMDILVRVVS